MDDSLGNKRYLILYAPWGAIIGAEEGNFMSRLVRESIEKAERLLDKKQGQLEEGIKRELESGLVRAGALISELKGLKDAAKEKRLDIDESARALARLARKAKRLVEVKEASQKAAQKNAEKAKSVAAKKRTPTGSKKGPAPKNRAAAKPATTKSSPHESVPAAKPSGERGVKTDS